MFKQIKRRQCLQAIKSKYEQSIGLLSDRNATGVYWSIWSCGDNILEAVMKGSEIRIYEYTPVNIIE